MKHTPKKAVIFLILNLTVILWLIIPGLSAEHTHSYAVYLKENPDCVSYGTIVYICDSCGQQKTEILEPLGHDFERKWRIDKEPTCLEEGVKSRHCTRCDAVTDVLAILTTNHSYINTVVEPTCTDYGYTRRVCQICGSKIETDYVKAKGHSSSIWIVDEDSTCVDKGLRHRECILCGETIETLLIDPKGHVYTDTVVAPTCTEKGYTLHKCRVCSYSYSDKTVKATGHSFPERGTLLTQPTCTQKGSEKVTCTICRQSETKQIAALGHDYSESWTIDKKATCTAAGEKSHHCTRCESRRNVTSIPKLEHTVVADKAVAPTCTQKGLTKGSHCSSCNKVIEKQASVPALGHSYKTLSVISKPTCTKTGEKKVVCTVCGLNETKATDKLGHNYSNSWTVDKKATCTASGEKSHHCTRCESRKTVTEIPKLEHTVIADKAVAPTCTQKGLTKGSHCSACNKVIEKQASVPALGHSHKTLSVISKPTCTKAGEEKVVCTVCGLNETKATDKLGHDYSESWTVDKKATCTASGEKSHHCTRCESRKTVTEIPKLEHTVIADKAVAPTCTQKGLTKGSHCSSCNKVIEKQASVPALGHSYKTLSVISKPTCTKTGEEKVVCTVCGLNETKATNKLGHNYSDSWTVDKKATCTASGEKSHHCTRCESRKTVTEIPKLEHTVIADKAVAPTCTQKGLTKGSHCSACNKVIEKQASVPALGHTPKTTVKKATTKSNGKISEACSVCGEALSSRVIYKIASVKLSSSSFSFDSKVKNPTVKVTDSKGKTLKKNKDYKVKYSAGRKKVGTYTAKVTFIGNYSGTKALSFKIIPKKPTGITATQTANSITLTWNKVSGATGYRIYEYNSKAKAFKAVATTKELYYKINNLKSATKHTYRIKAYKIVDGKNLFSEFSSSKKTATKPADFSISVSKSGQRAVLSWKKSGGCEYEIYRSNKRNGKFVCIGTTSKASFVTNEYARGTTCCFKVKACVKSSTTTLSSTSSDIRVLRF